MAQANPAQALANIYKTTELREKIVFTFLCLLVYRIGAHVTAPGVDVLALTDFFANQQGKGGGLLGLYDLFVGGGLSRATVFALGIMPYISASIFIQIAGAVIPTVDKLQKDEEGRKKVTQWTRYLTIGLAAVQAWGFALFTESLQGAVANGGFGFKVQMVLVLTTGAMFVMWLGEQITERGLGNGASLIIFFSIVERFWPGIITTFNFVSKGVVGPFNLVVLGLIMVAVVAGVVSVTLAARRVAIQIPQRTMARGKMREAAKNFIPLRLNSAGVMPIIFASSVIVVPGALVLTAIALLPQMIAQWINVPFQFGGTSLLIVVGVALDTMAQLQQHLLLRKYDGFMKKGRVRFRGRQPTGGF